MTVAVTLAVTTAKRSRRGAVVLGLVLVTMLAACASSGDAAPPRPSPKADRAASTGPTGMAPSPATGPSGAGLTGPVERSGFHGKLDELPAGLAAQMSGTTWHPGCPVALDGLRLLHFNYWGFGGNLLRGPDGGERLGGRGPPVGVPPALRRPVPDQARLALDPVPPEGVRTAPADRQQPAA